MPKIYLIGMPGSGKSTFGKQLAGRLLLPFVDLDKEIENAEGATISSIFSTHGEPYFRRAESKMLNDWASSTSSFVMATGGGTPCFHDGMGIINKTGVSVFLDVPAEELTRRMEPEDHRPLLSGEDRVEKIRGLLAARYGVYSRAMIHVADADQMNEIVLSIERILERDT